MKKRETLLLAIILFCLASSTPTLAQEEIFCSHDQRVNQMLEDKDFAKNYHQQRAEVFKKVAQRQGVKAPCTNPIILPVVVHYQSGTIPDQCMIDAALAQIEQINLDFSSCNSNADLFCTWINAGCTQYGGTAGADAMPEDGTCIQFCLADQNLPNDNSLIAGGYAITTGYSTNNQNASNVWRGYINMYVGNIGGAFGFVNFLGGASNPNTTQGASVVPSVFGSEAFAGCNVIDNEPGLTNGNVMSHELGHWFGLSHTFQDNVADTPPQNNPNSGCPSPPVNLTTCVSDFGNDYGGNFMDYVNGECMFIFTQDQVDIMQATVAPQNSWEINSISCYNDWQDGTIVYSSCNKGPCMDGVTCYSNLTNNTGLPDDENGVADYESSDFIRSTANINNGARVDYDATTYVQLDPGFNAMGGAIFNAFINGCNNGNGGVNFTGDDTSTSLQKQNIDNTIRNSDQELEIDEKNNFGKRHIQSLKDKAIEQINGMK